MTTIRQTTIYPTTIKLEARDQYNDYSVVADHIITVEYGNGRSARFDVGTNESAAIRKYDSAVALAYSHAAKAA